MHLEKINSAALPLEVPGAKLLLICGFVLIGLLHSVGAVRISSFFEKAQCSMAYGHKMCIMVLEESPEGG